MFVTCSAEHLAKAAGTCKLMGVYMHVRMCMYMCVMCTFGMSECASGLLCVGVGVGNTATYSCAYMFLTSSLYCLAHEKRVPKTHALQGSLMAKVIRLLTKLCDYCQSSRLWQCMCL